MSNGYYFGGKSRAQLNTIDPRLRAIAVEVIKIKDHSIIKGHRGEEEQHAAFTSDPQRSKLDWPNGKHNGFPSKAVDVQTYPAPNFEAELREEQLYLLGLYKGIGHQMGIEIRTGADWDRDGEIADNGFDDFYHVEIGA